MNNFLKTSLLCVGLVSITGLTACQNTPTQTQAKHTMPAKGEHGMRGSHHARFEGGEHRGFHGQQAKGQGFDKREARRAPLTAEQKAQFEQKRAERQAKFEAQRKAIQQACEGKVGQTISLKFGEKTVQGSCQVNFRPTRPQAPISPANTQPATSAVQSAS